MTQPETFFVCLATAAVSWFAFQNEELKARLLFQPRRILVNKEWYRLLSSALVHADWMHLGFNLFAFYSFGSIIEAIYGAHILLLVYLPSILTGSLLSLYLHRNQEYSARRHRVLFAIYAPLCGGSTADMLLN